VTPAPEARHAPPFWRAGERDRDGHLARRLGELLAECEQALEAGPARLEALLAELPLDAGARTRLAEYLIRQRQHTGAALPHAHHLLVECVRSGPGGRGPEAGQLVLHSFAGGRINRPWALILEERWRRRFGETPDIFAGNDAIVIQLAAGVDADTVLSLLSPDGLEEALRARLAGSGVFGARFRECAGRALLLRRNRFGERLPLWMSRLQARRLLGRVRDYGDFPIILEAWRSTLEEDCDLEGLRERLVDLAEGRLEVDIVHTDRPSPFAAASGWRQINEYMYAGDAPGDGEAPGAGLRPGLLDSVLGDARLRPRLETDMAEAFVRRRCRLEPGWGPRDGLELQDWLRERRLIDPAEFESLRALVPGDDRVWWQRLERDGRHWIVHERDRAAAERILADRTGAGEDELPDLPVGDGQEGEGQRRAGRAG
jgi:ATP-dependent Lhr-like helicase